MRRFEYPNAGEVKMKTAASLYHPRTHISHLALQSARLISTFEPDDELKGILKSSFSPLSPFPAHARQTGANTHTSETA